jgi:hypothetical protein
MSDATVVSVDSSMLRHLAVDCFVLSGVAVDCSVVEPTRKAPRPAPKLS